MKKVFSSIASCMILFFASAQTTGETSHTILFLGNSITYAGGYITDIEACYTLWHPEQNTVFINEGLPSETVSGLSEPGHADGKFPRPDLHERLRRVLERIKPTIIFACYGMNDGIYMPFDETRFNQYKTGMVWLHDSLVKTGARIIILTPPVYDEDRGSAKGYAAVLDKYADWLLAQKKNGWEVADIHYPMKKYLAAHRKLDADFGINGFFLAADGIHPGAAGHWLMAKQILLFLGEKKLSAYPDIQAAMATRQQGNAILKLVEEKQGFMKDAWLTFTGHKRPGMKTGLPLNEALSRATGIDKQIKDLLQATP